MASTDAAFQQGGSPVRQGSVSFLGLDFDMLGPAEADAWLCARGDDSPFAYVVTPNVDHLVRLEKAGEPVRQAYADADLCLCDSRVLARLAKLCGVELKVVTGSDLVARLFASVLRDGDSVLVVGSADDAITALRTRFPRFRILHHEAPMGLRDDPDARARVAQAAAAAGARIILLAIGSPQQELIASAMKVGGDAHGTALCIGASIDFLTGAQTRAPRFVQRAGFEWAWRLASDPRRLFRRYLVEGPAIFAMAWEWRQHRRGR